MRVFGCDVTCCLIYLLSSALMETTVIASGSKDVRYSPPDDVTLKHPDPLRGTIDVVWSFPEDYPVRGSYLRTYSHCIVRVSDGGEPWNISQLIPNNRYYTLQHLEPFSWYAVQVTCFCYFSGKLNWSHNVTFIMPGLTSTVKPLPTQQDGRSTIFSSQSKLTFSRNQMTSKMANQQILPAVLCTPQISTGTGVTLIYARESLDIGRLLPTFIVCGVVLAIVCLPAAVLSLMCRTRRNDREAKFVRDISDNTEREENQQLMSKFPGSSHCDPRFTESSVRNHSNDEVESV